MDGALATLVDSKPISIFSFLACTRGLVFALINHLSLSLYTSLSPSLPPSPLPPSLPPPPLPPFLQEGSGPCLFCGSLVCTPEEEELIARDSKKAQKFKEKLVKQFQIKVGHYPSFYLEGGEAW